MVLQPTGVSSNFSVPQNVQVAPGNLGGDDMGYARVHYVYLTYTVYFIYVTRSAKINHVSAQKSPHFLTLLCHISHFSYGNKMKFTSQMQKFMGNLMKLTEWKYLLQNIRYC